MPRRVSPPDGAAARGRLPVRTSRQGQPRNLVQSGDKSELHAPEQHPEPIVGERDFEAGRSTEKPLIRELFARLDGYSDHFGGLDPRRSLVVAARNGLPVFGRRPGAVEREPIPIADWGDEGCRVDSTFDGRRERGIHFKTGWLDLAATRSDVDRHWPPRPKRWILVHYGEKPPSPKRQSKEEQVGREEQLAAWFEKNYPNGRRPHGGYKEAYRKAGDELGFIVVERTARRARKRTK
jgi:hypothetical protein